MAENVTERKEWENLDSEFSKPDQDNKVVDENVSIKITKQRGRKNIEM